MEHEPTFLEGRVLKHLAEHVDAYHKEMAAAAQQGSTRTAVTMQAHAYVVWRRAPTGTLLTGTSAAKLYMAVVTRFRS